MVKIFFAVYTVTCASDTVAGSCPPRRPIVKAEFRDPSAIAVAAENRRLNTAIPLMNKIDI
jgi:hypothetical protein